MKCVVPCIKIECMWKNITREEFVISSFQIISLSFLDVLIILIWRNIPMMYRHKATTKRIIIIIQSFLQSYKYIMLLFLNLLNYGLKIILHYVLQISRTQSFNKYIYSVVRRYLNCT